MKLSPALHFAPQFNVASSSLAPFYEVYFLKFHLKEEKCALWLRYTLHAPIGKKAYASLWIMVMHAEDSKMIVGRHQIIDISQTHISAQPFVISFPHANLKENSAQGQIMDGNFFCQFNLQFQNKELFASGPTSSQSFYPHPFLYSAAFPKTKYASSFASLLFSGDLVFGEKKYHFEQAPGMCGHIWGKQHAQRWAWAHTSSFEHHSHFMFEALSAQIKAGPIKIPFLSLFTMRSEKEEFLYNSPLQWISNHSQANLLGWTFDLNKKNERWQGQIKSHPERMIIAEYEDPDLSPRFCHHDEWAEISLVKSEKKGELWKEVEILTSQQLSFEWVDTQKDSKVKNEVKLVL